MSDKIVTGIGRTAKDFKDVHWTLIVHRHYIMRGDDGLMVYTEVPELTEDEALERFAKLGVLENVERYVDPSNGFNVLRGRVVRGLSHHCFYLVYDVLYEALVDAQVSAIEYTELEPEHVG